MSTFAERFPGVSSVTASGLATFTDGTVLRIDVPDQLLRDLHDYREKTRILEAALQSILNAGLADHIGRGSPADERVEEWRA